MLVSCPYFITAGTAKNNITVVTSINRVVIVFRLGIFNPGIDIFTACAALDRIAAISGNYPVQHTVSSMDDICAPATRKL
ncbi:hypothetical protein CHUV0807_1090 [Cardiobacterium hominis]|uniref:Uncharacterized protein n=1 Tax=Cardiobacterium hominis TaxID=2718 RepID=A0A1C3H452_9GAMM|nr:hypothetical protein CHUV0807_1090 [Cardiobacterium hominis]